MEKQNDFKSSLQRLSAGVDKDHALAADYAYFIILTDDLRKSQLRFDNLVDTLRKPFEALGEYGRNRQKKLRRFRAKLNSAAEGTFSPISRTTFDKVVTTFDKVVVFYQEKSAKEFKDFILKKHATSDKDQRTEVLEELMEKLMKCLYHFDEDAWKTVAEYEQRTLELFDKVAETSFEETFSKYKKKEMLEENETYQIVNDLIVDPNAEKLDGKMKIVRVSSINNGNVLYVSLCLARQVASKNNCHYTFEVIRDFGNFKLKDYNKSDEELVERSMVFRVRRVLQQEKCKHEDPHTYVQCSCKSYRPKEPSLRCKNCGHEHIEITTYKELEKLPCILILQRKGRLGDTFPRSFNCMDLRVCYTNDVSFSHVLWKDIHVCVQKHKLTTKNNFGP